MKVGLTDAYGFTAKHLQWFSLTQNTLDEFIPIPPSFFEPNSVSVALHECDVIVHSARAHRGNSAETDIYDTNLFFAKRLIVACQQLEKKPAIIFVSSIHALKRQTSYGKAMYDAGLLFKDYGEKEQVSVTNVLVPHEFGEWGEPFSYSVVSTWCHELATGIQSIVNPDGVVELIHIQKIAHRIYDLMHAPIPGDVSMEGQKMSVSDLYVKLAAFKESYCNDVIPYFENQLELELFNTLRAHLFVDSNFYPRDIHVRSDVRGELFELIKERTGGQIFISSTKPGCVRGNHFHTRKIERFCVLQGDAEISMKQPITHAEKTFRVSGTMPQYIDMPTFFSHNITNVGSSDLITAFWTNEIFNPNDSDTYQFVC